MFVTVQALRLDQGGDATRRLVSRLTEPIRARGVLDVPLLISVDDEHDALMLVGFADRDAAEGEGVGLARVAVAKALAAGGIAADAPGSYVERHAGGSTSDSRYYRLAVCETESRALREFADRSATMSMTPTRLTFLWIGRADGGEAALVLTGYPDDSSFRAGSAIENVSGAARRELGVRLYAGGRAVA